MDAALSSMRLDDIPVTTLQLAKAMSVSRWTVNRWKEDGYTFEFGRLTTPGHLKAWLRKQALEKALKSAETDEENERQDAALARFK
jgi:hypothetical protein